MRDLKIIKDNEYEKIREKVKLNVISRCLRILIKNSKNLK